ncbi:hypothetical protein BDB00DRAFT_235701 [Zychaea mexicana]|uniref:uncharacterized protein n=1 Tax=Zychaea mexicana TaxID=64656 RepID=UPI0022FE2018|nr:uncharacterized protein BDB00DRAFT_235701 [Zychaea mexicana]KAI9495495.1 hypothetical protein BDB00DRAFT_235701 [Zychaea mexicana]
MITMLQRLWRACSARAKMQREVGRVQSNWKWRERERQRKQGTDNKEKQKLLSLRKGRQRLSKDSKG